MIVPIVRPAVACKSLTRIGLVVPGTKNRDEEPGFQNLLQNAVKYMGAQETPRIEVGARSEDDRLVYFVRDNGVGIDPQYHDNIFGLFERLDAGTEGTGVGLALVKKIVEVHGGRVWVESEGSGRGSTFCFTLPGNPAP